VTASQRRTFLLSLAGVVIVFAVIGGLIAAFGTGANRPEGVAERWLVAVGDTERKGVRERSRDEAEEVGPVSLAAHLLPDIDTGGKAAFVDLEVGKAVDASDDVRHVPFRLHQRLGDDVGDPIEGTVVLTKRGDDWTITAVDGPTPGLKVPSEGGAPAADAPWGLYLGAVAVASLCTLGCVGLVRVASRPIAT
jgi:hypothetical protein